MVVGKKGHCTLRIGWQPVNRVQHVAITRTGSSSHYEIACVTGTHFVWVRFGNAGLSYDADDTKWVPGHRMGSESHFWVPNGFIL